MLPNWTTCVSICALFRDSDVLNNTFGCDPLEIVQTISRNHCAYQIIQQQVIFIGILSKHVMVLCYKVIK